MYSVWPRYRHIYRNAVSTLHFMCLLDNSFLIEIFYWFNEIEKLVKFVHIF